MKLTKHKTEKPGIWQLRVDGRVLPYTIEKGDPPKFGERQEWLICKDEWAICYSTGGVGSVSDFLQDFLTAASCSDAR